MKKSLLFLLTLCIAGIFSVKAQSSSDSAFVRDLSYSYVNVANLPYSASASLTTSDKILKDVRAGYRGKGYTFTLSSSKSLDITLLSNSWDSYLILLDANFNVVQMNDDYINSYTGSRIIQTLTAGQYYLIVSSFSTTPTLPASFTLSIEERSIVPLSSLTATPITLPTTINDTLKSTDDFSTIDGETNPARCYSFQGTQNKILRIYSFSTSRIALLDNNRNIVKLGKEAIAAKLNRTGTYYIVFVGNPTTVLNKEVSMHDYQDYYIDGVNGNDNRNGLTASTAFATLDTALARSKGIGRYYFTEDYTTTNYTPRYVFYGELLPYQKDIHLNTPTSSSSVGPVAYAISRMVVGENGGTYNFLIENADFKCSSAIFSSTGYYSHLEVNNFKVRNSAIHGYIGYADTVIIRNCEYTNDSTSGSLFYFPQKGSVCSIINTTINQNKCQSIILGYEYKPNRIITLDNVTVTSNLFTMPQRFSTDSVIVKGGNWQNNNLSGNWTENSNTNILNKNLAGFLLENSVLNYGANFSMDVNNYICVDTASTVFVANNITAATAAQIYPFKMEGTSMNPRAVADYYEGRRLLSGSSSLLRANYQKFSVAQADASRMWYLHGDGKIYSQQGINIADEGSVNIYPNPTSDILNITLEGTTANEVYIMDVFGKTVIRANVVNGHNCLDMSALPAGMYFVQLRANNVVKGTQKLVKN